MLRSNIPRVVPRAGYPGIVRLLIAAAMLCGSIGLRSARADNTVTDWNAELLTVIQQTSISWVDGPPEVAREIAIFGNAMSDAVTAASGGGTYFAYSGGPVSGANASVATATAAYSALNSIFNDAAWQTPTSTPTGGTIPAMTLANTIVLPELQSFLNTQLQSAGITGAFSATTLLPLSCGSPATAACLGYNLGITAATAVTNAVAGDGAIPAIQDGLNINNAPTSGPDLKPGTPKITPGVYVPPATRPEMMPQWGTVAPILVTPAQVAAAQATVSGPLPIASQAYANALLQTECQGSAAPISSLPAAVQTACSKAGYSQETTAQAKAALFWNDPGTTIQPPGHWLQIADTVMQSQSTSLLQSAKLTALLGDAEDDAGIAAWGIKYRYNLWRPTTAIQACPSGQTSGAVTWNPYFASCDTTWSSLIATRRTPIMSPVIRHSAAPRQPCWPTSLTTTTSLSPPPPTITATPGQSRMPTPWWWAAPWAAKHIPSAPPARRISPPTDWPSPARTAAPSMTPPVPTSLTESMPTAAR